MSVRPPSQADGLEPELRLDQITERPFAVLIFVLIFMLTYFIYVSGILSIEQLRCQVRVEHWFDQFKKTCQLMCNNSILHCLVTFQGTSVEAAS